MEEYSSLSVETYALCKKYAKGVGAAAVREAVAESKLYTDQEISKLLSFNIEIVDTLPADPDTHTIYLVPKTLYEPNNGYFEYIYVDNKWELLGDTTIDLSDYYTKDEVNYLIELNKYELPIASTNTLGGIMIDDLTLKVDNQGVASIKEEGAVSIIEEAVKPIENSDITDLFK